MQGVSGRDRIMGLAAAVVCGILLLPAWLAAQTQVVGENQAPGRTLAQQATQGRQVWITADHSLHPALQQTFTSGPRSPRPA